MYSQAADYGPSEETHASASALHAIGLGVLFLDCQGALRYANPAGMEELRRGRALSLSQGLLGARMVAQEQSVHKAMSTARKGGRSMVWLGPPDAPRMVAFVPLDTAPEGPGQQRVLVVWSADPWSLELSMQLFAKATGLTPSEREVLQHLCKGHQAHVIAEGRAVKISTVRTQISSIRNKLGARTVSQVLAKMSQLPPLSARVLGQSQVQ